MSDTPTTTTDTAANDNVRQAANDNVKQAEGSPAQQNPEAKPDTAAAADQAGAKVEASQNGGTTAEGAVATRDPMAGDNQARTPEGTQDQAKAPEPAQDHAKAAEPAHDQATTQATGNAEVATEDVEAETDGAEAKTEDAETETDGDDEDDDDRPSDPNADLKAIAREILDSVIDELTDGSLPPEVREAIVNEIENVASTLTAEVKGWFDDWMGD